MKASIHNPYLDTLGGGERYTMSVALALLDSGYSVDVEWKDKNIIQKIENRFGMNLKGINVVDDIGRGDGYDVCFWVSDGSIPTLKSRKNILHFQVPFHDVNGKSLLNKMKLFRISKIVCNSNFTKNIIDKEFGMDSIVIYPPIDIGRFKPMRKENVILFVGRFSNLLQSKGQEILIQAFKDFYVSNRDWKLVLAGGVEVGVGNFIDRLKKISRDLNVEIITSPTFNEIRELCGKARFYWSASGFGINEKKEPEKLEHFGISTVEAMSTGAIPFAYNAGGVGEIIEDGIDGFLWNSTKELIRKTEKVLATKGKIKEMSLASRKKASLFTYERFKREIISLL